MKPFVTSSGSARHKLTKAREKKKKKRERESERGETLEIPLP
jgi:hypothetical protein